MLVYPFLQNETGIYSIAPPGDGPVLLVTEDGPPLPFSHAGPVFSRKTGLYDPRLDRGHQPVCITSQVTGGSFRSYLSEQQQRFGDRLWLYMVPLHHVFALPYSGIANETGKEQDGFFSSLLCCCYRLRKTPPQLILFDTERTMRQKLELAELLGVAHAFGEIAGK